MSSVNGRTAVITGAGSGIGQATARRLARHGCPVALADWNEDGLEETAASIAGPVLTRKLDVRDRQGVMAFAADVKEWAPQPLGLVFNNAGVTVLQGVADASPEDDQWVLDVNFHGVINGVTSFLPILLEQRSGVIVNTSSVFGLVGFPHQSAYCASKFAVRGYTEALRQELRGTGVRAAVVHPGGVKTNIVANARFRSDFRGDHAGRRQRGARVRDDRPDVARARREDHPRGHREAEVADPRRPRRGLPGPAGAPRADQVLRHHRAPRRARQERMSMSHRDRRRPARARGRRCRCRRWA